MKIVQDQTQYGAKNRSSMSQSPDAEVCRHTLAPGRFADAKRIVDTVITSVPMRTIA